MQNNRQIEIGDSQISVITVDEISAAADQIREFRSSVLNLEDEALRIMKETTGSWSGEARDAVDRACQTVHDGMQELGGALLSVYDALIAVQEVYAASDSKAAKGRE